MNTVPDTDAVFSLLFLLKTYSCSHSFIRELIPNLISVIIDCFDPVIESADNVIMLWSKVYMRYLPFHLQRCHQDLISYLE